MQVPGFDPTAVYVEFLVQKVTLVKFSFLSKDVIPGGSAEGKSEALVAAECHSAPSKNIQICMYNKHTQFSVTPQSVSDHQLATQSVGVRSSLFQLLKGKDV
jgi:hypothetical protein